MLPKNMFNGKLPKTSDEDGVKVNQNDDVDVFGRFYNRKIKCAWVEVFFNVDP
jgi:hypothetical protein